MKWKLLFLFLTLFYRASGYLLVFKILAVWKIRLKQHLKIPSCGIFPSLKVDIRCFMKGWRKLSWKYTTFVVYSICSRFELLMICGGVFAPHHSSMRDSRASTRTSTVMWSTSMHLKITRISVEILISLSISLSSKKLLKFEN